MRLPCLWKDLKTKADFYYYHPYSSPTSIEAHTFAVKTDQNIDGNYKSSLFWWNKSEEVAPSDEIVSIDIE